MLNTHVLVAEKQQFLLSSLSPSQAQRRLAFAVMIALILVALITIGLLSTFQPGRIDAFITTYAAALIVTDLITAVLLFAQFSIVRSRALAVLASGYLFAALIVIPWMLTFPGVFAPGGLLGAGLNSSQWLYNLRQFGFPIFVIAYALVKDADPTKRLWQGPVAAGVLSGVALTAALVCAATLLVTAGHALLPSTLLDPVHFSPLRLYLAGFQIGVSIAALIVLWVRLRSVLDLWLMVVMFAYAIEYFLIVFPVPTRFSMGWYAGRVYGLVSGSLLLVVLLYEIMTLYTRLLGAVLAQRHEREARLLTGDAVAASIAHEMRQPLTAMVTTADAGLRFLDRPMPNLDRAKEAFKRIVADGHRAGEVVGSIRANFKSDVRDRTALDINELIQEALALAQGELQKQGILVEAEPNNQLPEVRGNRVQVQQVLLNLVMNAIEAMAAKDEPRILSVTTEAHEPDRVMVSIADTGTGISSQDAERMFSPLFTTKPDGMGMGLPICRAIIEAHEGRLWFSPNGPRGTVLHFTLQAHNPASAAG